jgi:hypothetical protein
MSQDEGIKANTSLWSESRTHPENPRQADGRELGGRGIGRMSRRSAHELQFSFPRLGLSYASSCDSPDEELALCAALSRAVCIAACRDSGADGKTKTVVWLEGNMRGTGPGKAGFAWRSGGGGVASPVPSHTAPGRRRRPSESAVACPSINPTQIIFTSQPF